jgi:hypothetical protein
MRALPSTPISTHAALEKLQAYLEATQSQPYLLPNAMLQPDGPKAASDSNSNLTIHNLKRVEAGLRGEWLAPSLELNPLEGLDIPIAGDVPSVGDNTMTELVDGNGGADGEDWQDLDEYQREQSDIEGEIGTRQTGVVPGEGDGQQPLLQDGDDLSGLTEESRKQARKEAKKKRQEKEKKERVHKNK